MIINRQIEISICIPTTANCSALPAIVKTATEPGRVSEALVATHTSVVELKAVVAGIVMLLSTTPLTRSPP